MDHPDAVKEICRILLEEIGIAKACKPQQKVPRYGTSLLPAR
jgi:hypothetical protein